MDAGLILILTYQNDLKADFKKKINRIIGKGVKKGE